MHDTPMATSIVPPPAPRVEAHLLRELHVVDFRQGKRLLTFLALYAVAAFGDGDGGRVELPSPATGEAIFLSVQRRRQHREMPPGAEMVVQAVAGAGV